MQCTINGKMTEIPTYAEKGIICPNRTDYFQSACNLCDYCGRNEAIEHGETYKITSFEGFGFYTDCITDINDKGFTYGCKTISFSQPINFVNVEYLNDKDMIVKIHFANKTIWTIKTDNQELISKLAECTDLCSVK